MKQLLFLLLSSAAIALYLSNRNERQCAENLHSMAVGLEMYSSDASGRYPQTLEAAVRRDGLKIPTCPAAGCDTYSASYQSTMTPDSFTLSCQGYHHGSVRLIYTAEEGFVRKPAP